jgi:hypothetical protein
MAGLGPATHVFLADADEEDVDGRATPGHDSGIDESLSTSVGLKRHDGFLVIAIG